MGDCRMTTLVLTLDRKNIDPMMTSCSIKYLIYRKGNKLALLNMQEKLDLVKLHSGKREIVFPVTWLVYSIDQNLLNKVVDLKGDVDWSHPLLEPLSIDEWDYHTDWVMDIENNRGKVKLTTSDNGDWVSHGYNLQIFRSNVKGN